MAERATDFIAEAITDHWGERCSDFDPCCFCCLAWRQYDENADLRRRLEEAERERDEALQGPWPKWADEIRKILVGYGVDPGDEWDLPEQFEMWLTGVVENETARADKAEARLSALEDQNRALAEDRLNDLGRLLNALGMGDHARPISPAEVFSEAIRKIEALRAALEYAREKVVRYAHTQGNNAEYHRQIVAPIDRALTGEAR